MQIEFERIKLRLDRFPSKLILDIGAGKSCDEHDTNDLVKWLIRTHKVIGVDLKEVLYSHPNFTFIKQSFLDNCFENKYFDIIISVATLHSIGKCYSHGVPRDMIQKEDVNGPLKAIEEIYRILKKDGDFFLAVDVSPSIRRNDMWYWSRKDVIDMVSPYFKIAEMEINTENAFYTKFLLHLIPKSL